MMKAVLLHADRAAFEKWSACIALHAGRRKRRKALPEACRKPFPARVNRSRRVAGLGDGRAVAGKEWKERFVVTK